MHTGTAQPHGRPHSHPPCRPPSARRGQVPAAAKSKLYNPRHPERTLLYQTVAEHFETWY